MTVGTDAKVSDVSQPDAQISQQLRHEVQVA